MPGFKENHCRCCKKVFCCKKCRENHENLEHGVFPDCDICLYGKAVLTNASDILLNHVKSVHWPLRCLFCKRFFGTTDELKRHNKCPVGLNLVEEVQKSPYTPGQSHNEISYDSPPLSFLLPKGQQLNKNLNMFANLATSTPMQRNNENNLLEQITDAITPVDYTEITNKDSISKPKVDSDALKRKVTFCETPMAESYRTQKNGLKKKNSEKDVVSTSAHSGSISSGIFYSVKEEPLDLDPIQDDEKKDTQQNKIPVVAVELHDEKTNENKENIDIKHEDSTLWISAINVTSDVIEEKPEVSSDHPMLAGATPTASKQKKRQISIVMPTPFPKKIENSFQQNVIETKPDIKVEENISTQHTDLKTIPKVEEENGETSTNIQETISETSLNIVQRRLWISMSRLFKNVTSAIQSVSSITEDIPRTLKRCSTDYDSIDGPSAKRYKLTDIKCRPTIRQLPRTRTASWEVHESFRNSYEKYRRNNYVDKATQTDDYLFVETSKTN